MPVHYSVGQRATDIRPVPAQAKDFASYRAQVEGLRESINVTPADSKEVLSRKKKRLPYLWGAMRDVSKGRSAVNADDRDVLWLDMDGCLQKDWRVLQDCASAYLGFACSTASHEHPTAQGEQRWRLCFSLSRRVAVADYKRLCEAAERELMKCYRLLSEGPVKWDRAVYHPDHMVYAPHESAVFIDFSGAAIDADRLLTEGGDVVIPSAPAHSGDALSRLVDLHNVTQETFEDLRSAMWYPAVLVDAQPGQGRHSAWVSMGCRLAWFIDTEFENQARALWLEWSEAGGGSAEDIADAKNRWDKGKLAADRTGFQAVFSRARQKGWKNPATERLRLSAPGLAEESTTGDTRLDIADTDSDMARHFLERFIYVIEGDQVCDLSRPPYQCIMDMKSFRNLMAPYKYPPVGKGQPVHATKRWIEHHAKQIAESVGYQPGADRLIERPDGRFEINEFYMPEHPPVTDTRKVSTFLNHMTYLVPDEWQRNFFIARLAWFVQRPDRRCPVTILHVSTAHGTGRGWLSQLMERILGKWNCSRTRMKILCENQFHDCLYHTLLCTIDEVRENDKRYEVNDKIRDVLTEPRFEVNRKYGSKRTIDIFTGFLLYTNHHDAIALPEEDRRIAVLGGPDIEAAEENYVNLYAALNDNDFIAQVYWYLMNLDLSVFNWQRAPDTKERQLMIESNKSDLETAVISMLENPPTPAMTYQQIVNEIIKDAGLEAGINQKHITKILKERTKREPVRVKIDGATQRFWLLEKNCAFSNTELRKIFEDCENMQNQLWKGVR